MGDYLYGINPVTESLESAGRRPLELLLLDGARPARLARLEKLALVRQVPVRWLSRDELDRQAGHARHQGAALRLEPFCYTDLETLLQLWRSSGRNALFLVLDGITDPHNFGALLRSAEAAGCHGVIVARDRACPVTPVVEKAAAGALAYLPLCQVTNLARTLELLKAAGIWCYGLAGDGPAEALFTTDLQRSLALVVGSEGKGLRPNIRSHCDLLLALPMRGRMTSLNASVAAGIALYEVVRQTAAGSLAH
jgi:23S rRNA (guanosine2251-2'-O)-methyltransferase